MTSVKKQIISKLNKPNGNEFENDSKKIRQM